MVVSQRVRPAPTLVGHSNYLDQVVDGAVVEGPQAADRSSGEN